MYMRKHDLGDELAWDFRHTGESRYPSPLCRQDAGLRRHDDSAGVQGGLEFHTL
jgi:hypothetical protein